MAVAVSDHLGGDLAGIRTRDLAAPVLPLDGRAVRDAGQGHLSRAAAECTVMLAEDPRPRPPGTPPAPGKLSTREQELVTLVAQGDTDAQIAARLYISVRTVRSRLDRIRDKTGCRRRADLARLALAAGLI